MSLSAGGDTAERLSVVSNMTGGPLTAADTPVASSTADATAAGPSALELVTKWLEVPRLLVTPVQILLQLVQLKLVTEWLEVLRMLTTRLQVLPQLVPLELLTKWLEVPRLHGPPTMFWHICVSGNNNKIIH